MLPSSALYKQAITRPHHRESRVDIKDIDGNTLLQDVRIVDGSVSAQLTDRVTRSAAFALPDDFYPRSATDPLSPYQAVAHIRSGIRYGDGSTEMFPLFVGRVHTADRGSDGLVTFEADDLASDVLLYRFEQPWVRRYSASIITEIEAMITDALPQAVFGTHDVADTANPTLVWDEDRGKALDDLASALGARWFALGDGSFVIRSYLYTDTTPVQQFLDGPGGLMISAQTSVTRDGTANSVVVVSERVDGTDPVRVVARDTTVGSPTQFGGKFGKVSQILKIQTPLTTSQAQTLALTQLNSAQALTEQWSSLVVPDHTMEPGDTVQLRYRDLVTTQIIDSIDYPLGPTEAMGLGGRSVLPEGVSVDG